MRKLRNSVCSFSPHAWTPEISLRNLWSRRYSSKAPSSTCCFKIRMRLFEVFSRTVLMLRGSPSDRTNLTEVNRHPSAFADRAYANVTVIDVPSLTGASLLRRRVRASMPLRSAR